MTEQEPVIEEINRRIIDRIIEARRTPLSGEEKVRLKVQMARVKMHVAGTGCFLEWWLKDWDLMEERPKFSIAEPDLFF